MLLQLYLRNWEEQVGRWDHERHQWVQCQGTFGNKRFWIFVTWQMLKLQCHQIWSVWCRIKPANVKEKWLKSYIAIKFMFTKKATKIDEIFIFNLTLCKNKLPKEGILFRAQFSSQGIFINKKVGFQKN